MRRFLIYTITYLLVTALATFGTLTINNLTSNKSASNQNILVAQSVGDKLLSKIMTMGSTELNLNVDLFSLNKDSDIVANKISANANKNERAYNAIDLMQNAKVSIAFRGNLNIADFENVKMNGNIDLCLDGKNLSFFVTFLNNVFYISNENINLRFDVNNISKIFDLLGMLGLNLDLGIDFSNIKVDSIMASLQNIKETKLQDGSLKLELAIADFVTLNIYCDSEYNVRNIEADNFIIGNYTIKLNANLNKKDNIEIENPESEEEKQYVDFTNTLNIIESIKGIIASKQVHLNLNCGTNEKLNNILVNGGVDLNFENDLKFWANLNLEMGENNHNLKVGFLDSQVYLDINNSKFKCNKNSIDQIIDIISKQNNLSKVESINLFDLIKKLTKIDINYILENSIRNYDFKNLIAFSKGETDSINIKIFGNKINVENDIILSINQTSDGNLKGINIKGIEILGKETFLNLEQNNIVKFPTIQEDEYIDLNNAPMLVESLMNSMRSIKENKTIAFNLSTQITYNSIKKDNLNNIINSTKICINMLDTSFVDINFSNMLKDINNIDIKELIANVVLDLELNKETTPYISGIADKNNIIVSKTTHKLKIKFINQKLYISIDKMNMQLNINNLDSVITTICDALKIDIKMLSLERIQEIIQKILMDKTLLHKLSFDMINELSILNNQFILKADLSKLNLPPILYNIDLALIYNKNGIQNVKLNNIIFNNGVISFIDLKSKQHFEIKDYTENEQDQFLEISGLENIIEAVKNTMEIKDFDITGNVKLNLNVVGIKQNFNIPVDAKISLVNNKISGKLVLGPIPVIAGVNDDVPYQFGNTVDGINSGKDRVLTIYIKDDMVYFYRKELVPVFASADKVYEKKLKIHFDTLKENPLHYILQYGLGLSSKIMGAIESSMNMQRVNPLDISNILKSYEVNNNVYTLVLNLAELTGNTQLDTFTLGIKIGDYLSNENNQTIKKSCISGVMLNMFMPIAKSVEIALNSDNIQLNNIGKQCNMDALNEYVLNYTYSEGASWDAYNGDWNLSSQRKFSVEFITNSNQKIDKITGIAGAKYVLPMPNNYAIDDGKTCEKHQFIGWYTTTTFDKGSEYTESAIPRKDIILYAKWNVISLNYITISFVTNGGKEIIDIKALEGSIVNLPTYHDLIIENNNNSVVKKQFEGWYLEKELKNSASDIAPNVDTILYAKWVIVDTENAFKLNIYDNEEKILTKYLFNNDKIVLNNSSKFNLETKYYLDKEFKKPFLEMVMPNNDLDLYIQNKYNLSVVSKYGNVLNLNTLYYQNENIQLQKQTTYYEDDGTQTERVIYSFNGYYLGMQKINDLNNFIMPNRNCEVIADWKVDIKQYYTVTFNMALNYIPKSCYLGCYYVQAPQEYKPVKILDGEILDLSNYRATCKINSTAIALSKRYDYIATTWGIKKHADKKDGGDGFTSIVVTNDTTLYPYWKKQ